METGHATRLSRLIDHMKAGLYEREEAVRLSLLAALAGESIFFLGPPGTAKSLIARRLKFAIKDARAFEYLMGKFSTPEEVFGPISVRRLRDEDRYERITDRYLPEAEVAFLDEIWKASPPIQNALLTALNEKLFRNGREEIRLPLRCVIGASNELPDPEEATAAFWDRFLLRLRLDPIVERSGFTAMLTDPVDPYADPVPEELKLGHDELDRISADLAEVALPPAIGDVIWNIRSRVAETVTVSDRRWRKIVRLLRASALANGRTEVDIVDCGIIPHCLWDNADHIDLVRDLVSEVVRRRGPLVVVNLGPAQERYEALERTIANSTHRAEEREVAEPVIHFGEYILLVDYAPDSRVYLWKADYDELPPEGLETSPVDLFFYDEEGNYERTEPADAARAGDGAVSIDGRLFEVDRKRSVREVAVFAAPDPVDRSAWEAEIGEIGAIIEEAIAAGLAFKTESEDDASTHLFVPRSFGAIVAAGIDAAVDRAAELRIQVEELRKRWDNAPL